MPDHTGSPTTGTGPAERPMPAPDHHHHHHHHHHHQPQQPATTEKPLLDRPSRLNQPSQPGQHPISFSVSTSLDEKPIDTIKPATPDSITAGSQSPTTPSPDNEAGDAVLTPAAEARLRRKFDRTLMVLVFCSYLLAFLDRSNIGNAEAAGMSADLGFDDAEFQVSLILDFSFSRIEI